MLVNAECQFLEGADEGVQGRSARAGLRFKRSLQVRPANPPRLTVIMLTTSMPGAQPPNQLESLGKTEREEAERGPLGGIL